MLTGTQNWDSCHKSHKLHVLFRGFIDSDMTVVYNAVLSRDIHWFVLIESTGGKKIGIYNLRNAGETGGVGIWTSSITLWLYRPNILQNFSAYSFIFCSVPNRHWHNNNWKVEILMKKKNELIFNPVVSHFITDQNIQKKKRKEKIIIIWSFWTL